MLKQDIISKNKMIKHNSPTLGTEEEQAALKVIQSGWLAHGSEVVEFENEFCEFIGLPEGNAVAVTNGTSALFLALWALQAQDRKVALPVYACSSLRHAAAMARAKELLLDVDHGTPNISLDQLTQSDADIAIVPHMYGLPLDISACKDIDVVEDCAQAIGASVDNVSVGLRGKLGIYSFYATKLITSGGHGGMVVSKDKTIIDTIRNYKEFDQRRDRKKRFNFHMTDIQAAIGSAQLKKLPQFLQRRSEIFELYKQAELPMLDTISDNLTPVRYRAVLLTKRPAEIIKSLQAAGIESIVPVEDWELLGEKELFPNALELTKQTVSLPIYPSLSTDDVNKIITVVKDNF